MQADIPKDQVVHIRMPKGYEPVFGQDMVLRLNESLYGQVDAPKMWYEKLLAGLEARGFTTFKVDHCLFISKKVIVVAIADDFLFFSRNQVNIDELIKSFRDDGDKYNWEVKVAGTVHNFFGIEIKNLDDGGY